MIELNINWYPGHMAKTFKQLKDKVKVIDLAIIIVDARIPHISFFKELRELVINKPLLILINKTDLGDMQKVDKLCDNFKEEKIAYLKIDCKNNIGIDKIKNMVENVVLKEKIKKAKEKNISLKPYKVAILGIPNSGKSSLINRINKKAKTIVKNMPGTTKDISWTRLNDDFVLLDTPGLLWPKLSQKDAIYLAFIGSIPDENLDIHSLVYNLVIYLKKEYPGYILKKYNVSEDEKTEDIINNIGIKKGCLLKGNIVNIEVVCKLILKDLRNGALGRITFENI